MTTSHLHPDISLHIAEFKVRRFDDIPATVRANWQREQHRLVAQALDSFPTGFARGLPSIVTLHGMDSDRTLWRQEYQWHDNPFKLELLHFGACIRTGQQSITTGRDAIADIALVGDIGKAYLLRLS